MSFSIEGHRAAAMRTKPSALESGLEAVRRCRRQQRISFQQLPAERQQFAAAPVGEEAAEADAHEAARQSVEQEPPQELLGGHCHQPLLALVRIVFPAEGDLAVGKVHDPVVGDGDAMRVAGQIVEDMFGSSEWPFGVDHPVVAKQRPQESMERFLLGEPFQTAGEPQFPCTESAFQTGDELAAKHAAQHLHRQEERDSAGEPSVGDRARDHRPGSRNGHADDAEDSVPRCGAH